MSTTATPTKMSTKTKVIIGVLILAALAAAYYFFVYKPKAEEEKETQREENGGIPSGITEEMAAVSRQKGVGDPKKGYWKKGEWYFYR